MIFHIKSSTSRSDVSGGMSAVWLLLLLYQGLMNFVRVAWYGSCYAGWVIPCQCLACTVITASQVLPCSLYRASAMLVRHWHHTFPCWHHFNPCLYKRHIHSALRYVNTIFLPEILLFCLNKFIKSNSFILVTFMIGSQNAHIVSGYRILFS